jgi:hypothetical protein
VIITVRMPILRSGETLADAALDDVLEVDDAQQPAVLGDRQRRAARLGDLFGDLRQLARRIEGAGGRGRRRAMASTASTAPLRIDDAVESTPLMRVCAENGMNFALIGAISRPRMPYFSFASTTMERPSGVSSDSEASCAASASSAGDAGAG